MARPRTLTLVHVRRSLPIRPPLLTGRRAVTGLDPVSAGCPIQSRSPQLVVSSGQQFSFEALQRRAASCGGTDGRPHGWPTNACALHAALPGEEGVPLFGLGCGGAQQGLCESRPGNSRCRRGRERTTPWVPQRRAGRTAARYLRRPQLPGVAGRSQGAADRLRDALRHPSSPRLARHRAGLAAWSRPGRPSRPGSSLTNSYRTRQQTDTRIPILRRPRRRLDEGRPHSDSSFH